MEPSPVSIDPQTPLSASRTEGGSLGNGPTPHSLVTGVSSYRDSPAEISRQSRHSFMSDNAVDTIPSPDPALNLDLAQDINLDQGHDPFLGTDQTQSFESVVSPDPSRGPDPDPTPETVTAGDLVIDPDPVAVPNQAPERPKRARKVPDCYGD